MMVLDASQHFPIHYERFLREKGIQCQVFNPFRPLLNIVQNNRDHRKICVIDGKTGFTGGINLADEYINQKESFWSLERYGSHAERRSCLEYDRYVPAHVECNCQFIRAN